MANKLIGILLLASLAALGPAQARNEIRESTVKKANGLLKAAHLGNSRDEAMTAIEQLAQSLNNGSWWFDNSPKRVLEMLVELYKANKANEARRANPDCGNETDAIAWELYQAMMKGFQYKKFVRYAGHELGIYSKICADIILGELRSSIASLNATIDDRVRTLGKKIEEDNIVLPINALYEYMVEQTRKEQDPDAKYLKKVIDPNKQKVVRNTIKIMAIRFKYVERTCKSYFDAAGPALFKASWVRDALILSEIWLPQEMSGIYEDNLVYLMSFEACLYVARWPYWTDALMALID